MDLKKNQKKLLSYFKKNCITDDISPLIPIQLSLEDCVWYVETGKVDIFSVNKDSLERDYVCSINEGEICVSFNDNYNLPYNFIGVPQLNTHLLKIKKQQYIKAVKIQEGQEFYDYLVYYINSLSSSNKDSKRPQFTTIIDSGTDIHTSGSGVLGSHEDIVWLKMKTGIVYFNGIEQASLNNDSGIFPLPKGFWIESKEDFSYDIIDIGKEAKNSKNKEKLISSIDNLINNSFLWISNEIKNKSSMNIYRIQDRLRFEENFRTKAIEDLASTMDESSEDERRQYTDDFIFKAFQEIGIASEIEFQAPPRWQAPWLWKRDTRGSETIQVKNYDDPIDIICQASKIKYRKVILKNEWWKRESGAILAFLKNEESSLLRKMDYVIALIPTGPGHYQIYNPKDDSKVDLTEDMISDLDPVAFVFYRPFRATVLKFKPFFDFILPDIRTDIKLILLTGLAGFILGLVNPWVTAHLFNTVIPNSDKGQLIQVFFLLLVAAFSGLFFNVTQGWSQLRMESKINASMQTAVFDRILSLPLPFFRKYTAGDMAIRATGINRVRQALGGATLTAIMTSMEGLGSLAMVFYYSTKLASTPEGAGGGMGGAMMLVLAGIAILILNISLTVAVSYRILKYQRAIQELAGKISGLVLQFMSSISKLRVSGMESRAFSVWAQKFKKQNKLSFKAAHLGNYISIYNLIIPTASSMLFYFLIGYSFGSKPGVVISAGYFMAFFTSFTGFMASITGLASTLVGLINIIPAIERSRPIIECPPEVSADASSPGQLMGEIEVRNLYFSYEKNGPMILEDVSINSAPGEFIALVGPSGSGKSTLLKILLGFDPPHSGSAYFDQKELKDLDINAVRKQIGVVTQESGVLAGSVFQNIVGASHRSLDDAWEAAKMAGLDQDIDKMPMGMHTVISEGGSTISGGQRQRLLIARALINKPRIIFFDEATSALDNKTQKTVSDSLEQMNATRIVVAHRLSTIQNADRIYVLEKGRIVETGNFESLIEAQGLFSRLASRQMT